MLHQTTNDIGARLMSIVATGASQFDANDLKQLHLTRDMNTEIYQKVFRSLNGIKDSNPDITFIYILRPVEKPNLWEFVADSYSNYNLALIESDLNNDGVLGEADENVAPGIRYWDKYPNEPIAGLERPSYEKQFYSTQWGTLTSGYAPIKNQDGKEYAILGADMDVSKFYVEIDKRFSPWLWFMAGFSFVALLYLLFKKQVKDQFITNPI
jgi:hypothetical protein